MALAAENIVVGGTGRIYVAPVGTTLPNHLSAPLDSAFVDLGYTTADGVKFTDTKNVNKIRPWQSFYAVRMHVIERDAMAEFTLLEWKEATVGLAFGGGSFTQPYAGEYRYHPPSPETIDERAMVIDISDGDDDFRFVLERGFVTNNVESTFAKSGPSLLPITFEVLASDTGDPWTFDANDAALAPAAS